MSARSIIQRGALLLLLLSLWPASAWAHGSIIGSTQTSIQSVGPYELAVAIEIPQNAPSPLNVTITPQTPLDDVSLALRVAPRGQPFTDQPITLRLSRTYPSVALQLYVSRAGGWELELQVSGALGSGIARIPFTIIVPRMSANSVGLLVSVGALFVLLLLNMALQGIAHARRSPWPRWLHQGLGLIMFGGAVVAAMFGIQLYLEPPQSVQSAAGSMAMSTMVMGTPHANAVLRMLPEAPQAGQPLDLSIDLSDGSTGMALDDLDLHHEALMHLLVIDASGGFFAHMHPARIAPGRFTISLTPTLPGRYTAYIEIERQDSGVQVLSRNFSVGGSAPAQLPPQPAGLGAQQVDGLTVDVRSSLSPLRAGKQATLTFSLREGAAPVRDLQLWLGMPGHLIVRNDDGAILGHIHSIEPLPPIDQIGSARYGPDVRFVYTFPQPGHYLLWGQFQRNGTIITVPLQVNVES